MSTFNSIFATTMRTADKPNLKQSLSVVAILLTFTLVLHVANIKRGVSHKSIANTELTGAEVKSDWLSQFSGWVALPSVIIQTVKRLNPTK